MRTSATLLIVLGILMLVLTACVSIGGGRSPAIPAPTWSREKAIAAVAATAQTEVRERIAREAKATYNYQGGFWVVVWETVSEGKRRRCTWRVDEKDAVVVPVDEGAKGITPLKT